MSRRRRPGPQVPVRLHRASAFAATSAVLAWLAHAVGGEPLPSGWLLLLGGAVIAALSYPLLSREATWTRIGLGLAAAQVMLHGWLTATAGHAGHGAAHGVSARMLVAHLAATAAALVWLRYAEHRVWERARQAWVALILHRRRWLSVPEIHRSPSGLPVSWRPPVLAPQFLISSCGTRGPPLALRP